MKIKFLLYFIGWCCGLTFLSPLVHAQSSVSADCNNTLYSDTFKCTSKKVKSYCQSSASGAFNIYRSSYCEVSKNNDDEIFKIVAKQLAVEDSKYNDPTLIKFLYEDIQRQSIEEFLELKYGSKTATDQLPVALKESFFNSSNYSDQIAIRQRVKRAYHNQKILFQTKKSLKSQFESSEIWMDGSLLNSPFDLVVDLNLIEKILFGTRGTWLVQKDVWKWPSKDAFVSDDKSDPKKKEDVSADSSKKTQSGQNNPVDYECRPLDPSKKDSLPIPSSCGNGKKEVNESCDDGNQKSGDGCSARCEVELGSTAVCKDVDALSLKPFVPSGNSVRSGVVVNQPSAQNSPPLNCPPGTKAVPRSVDNVVQNPNYGGLNVGGVFKNLPVSRRPDCPEGTQSMEFSLLGEPKKACVPSQLCADPNIMRDFLFNLAKNTNKDLPKSWQDLPEDDPLRKNLDAIEVAACIKITKGNRPVSPYPKDESCVDCHLLAMNDSMSKLLEKSVAPSQNPMQAFGLTNRWGPRFTFDLNITFKALKNIVVQPKVSSKKAKENTDEYLVQLYKKADSQLGNTVNSPQSGVDILTRITNDQNQKKDQLKEQLKWYQVSTLASAGQNTNALIVDSLTGFKASFDRMQIVYDQLMTSVDFAQKRQCTF